MTISQTGVEDRRPTSLLPLNTKPSTNTTCSPDSVCQNQSIKTLSNVSPTDSTIIHIEHFNTRFTHIKKTNTSTRTAVQADFRNRFSVQTHAHSLA